MFDVARLVTIARLAQPLVLGVLAGCAGQSATKTGFLGSYDGMQPTAAHAADLIYVDPDYSRDAYDSVVIDPIAWNPVPGAPARDSSTIAQLKADFRKSLEETLGKDFKLLVAAPSPPRPAILRVRAAITNTRQAHWWINAPVAVAGVGLTLVGVPAGGLPSPAPGGASEELEVLDDASGKRLVAIATFNNAMPWNKMGDFQQFGHARRAFRIAAELLHEQLAGGGVADMTSTSGAQISRR